MAYYPDTIPEGEYDRRYLNQELRKISDGSVDTDERLDTLETNIIELVPSGYGGMSLDTPVLFDIVAAFTTVPFDANNPAASRGITFNLTNNTYSFTAKGVWQVIFNFALEGHNSSNAGRNFGLRIFNVTTATVASKVVQQGIGRNETYTLVSLSFLVEITQATVDAGESFRFEVGGGDLANGGTLNLALGQFTHASELGLLI